MAAFMLVGVVLTLVISEPESDVPAASGLRKALTAPFEVPLRHLFADHTQVMGKVVGIIYGTISTHLIHKAEYRLQDGAAGIEVCSRCGGSVRVIACIEDQDVIDRILDHLRETGKEAPARPLLVPPTRAPPATLSLFAGTEFHQQGRH